ncbi:MAG: LysE family transporter, partial [Chloroflexi bacterium]|nr:LysE family transporter [Chloroflexota bacterium]
MIDALATGALFGLSAGLAPGPLLALVISQTVRHGPGHGVRVAVAPLITDLPIVVVCVLIVGSLEGSSGPLAIITLGGAAFVAWLAWDTWRADAPGAVAGGETAPAPRSWTSGVVVNGLSPHPWLFWIAVGAPTMLASYAAGGLGSAVAFLVGFYGCLVGSKVGIALVVGRARGRIAGSGYRLVMRLLAALLAAFAIGLLREGLLL